MNRRTLLAGLIAAPAVAPALAKGMMIETVAEPTGDCGVTNNVYTSAFLRGGNWNSGEGEAYSMVFDPRTETWARDTGAVLAIPAPPRPAISNRNQTSRG